MTESTATVSVELSRAAAWITVDFVREGIVNVSGIIIPLISVTLTPRLNRW